MSTWTLAWDVLRLRIAIGDAWKIWRLQREIAMLMRHQAAVTTFAKFTRPIAYKGSIDVEVKS